MLVSSCQKYEGSRSGQNPQSDSASSRSSLHSPCYRLIPSHFSLLESLNLLIGFSAKFLDFLLRSGTCSLYNQYFFLKRIPLPSFAERRLLILRDRNQSLPWPSHELQTLQTFSLDAPLDSLSITMIPTYFALLLVQSLQLLLQPSSAFQFQNIRRQTLFDEPKRL